MLKGYDPLIIEEMQSDQERGEPLPSAVKPFPADAPRIDLVPGVDTGLGAMPFAAVVAQRCSRRRFVDEAMTLAELSFVLWATQGIRRVSHDNQGRIAHTLRTVPSAGARHPFETYVAVRRVDGVPPGLYQYLPVEHKLGFVSYSPSLMNDIVSACHGQAFVGRGAVVLIWTALPYRMEWRYANYAQKFVALDAGHVGQNLYLAAEAIGCATCTIGAYLQPDIDKLIGVDGNDEFTIYLAPVGRAFKPKIVALSSATLQRFTGKYALEEDPQRTFEVNCDGNQIRIRGKSGPWFDLKPQSDLKFLLEDADLEIEFEASSDGAITALWLVTDNGRSKAPRVAPNSQVT